MAYETLRPAEAKIQPESFVNRAEELLSVGEPMRVWRIANVPTADMHPTFGAVDSDTKSPAIIEAERDTRSEYGGYFVTLRPMPNESGFGRPVSLKSVLDDREEPRFDALRVELQHGEDRYKTIKGLVNDEWVTVEGSYPQPGVDTPVMSTDAEFFANACLNALEAPNAQIVVSSHPSGLGRTAIMSI